MNAASAPPPAGAASLQLLQPQQAPSSYEVPPVPAALRDSLYILDAKKGQHMLHHLDQVRAMMGDWREPGEGGRGWPAASRQCRIGAAAPHTYALSPF